MNFCVPLSQNIMNEKHFPCTMRKISFIQAAKQKQETPFKKKHVLQTPLFSSARKRGSQDAL